MNLWNNRNFTPMLLNEEFKPFDSDEYLFELKYDGIRALIFADDKEVYIENPKSNVRKIFNITGLDKIFKMEG